MTNKQKIAELETKLRRYEKRTGDLQKLNAKLAAQVVGSTQIGKRLTLPPVEVSELLKRYEVHARKDDGGQYIIGVGLRDDPNDHKGGNA